MSHENIMRLWNAAVDGGFVRPKLSVVVKTASHTVTANDFGKVLTTRGASDIVTFTLPTAGDTNNGDWVLFINVADEGMFVAGDSGGLVIFNDLTADNIGYATASKLIGGAFLAISDGTSWIVLPIGTETQTVQESSSTATSTSTGTGTSTATSTATGTSTSTATGTSTKTSTGTSTSTSSATASTSGTVTDSSSATASASSTKTSTATSTATGTATSTPTGTSTKTSTATGTATSTATSTGTP